MDIGFIYIRKEAIGEQENTETMEIIRVFQLCAEGIRHESEKALGKIAEGSHAWNIKIETM